MGAAAPFAVLGGLQLAGGIYQSQGIREMGKWEEQQNNFNARMADIQAKDALRRGEKDVSLIRRSAKQTIGSQRVATAGQGVLVDVGTPGDLVDDTRKLSEEDIQTARNNAWRESFGYKTQSVNYRNQARMSRLAAKNQAWNTLISAGLGAGSSFVQGYGQSKAAR